MSISPASLRNKGEIDIAIGTHTFNSATIDLVGCRPLKERRKGIAFKERRLQVLRCLAVCDFCTFGLRELTGE